MLSLDIGASCKRLLLSSIPKQITQTGSKLHNLSKLHKIQRSKLEIDEKLFIKHIKICQNHTN